MEIITYILEGALKHEDSMGIVVGESSLNIRAEEPSEILLFDLQ